MPKVRKIHAQPQFISSAAAATGTAGLRVAAYARVSTTMDEQNSSFQAQKEYPLIKSLDRKTDILYCVRFN